MDFRRLILYFALALVAMMLWQNWQKEHPNNVATTQTPVAAPHTAVANSSPVTDVPVIADAHAQSAPSAASSVPVVQATPANRIVTVKTDTLVVKIDKQGGNLISAELVNYAKDATHLKQPMQLFSDKAESLYLAQSGLTGKDGPDTARGQVTFHSNQSQYQMAAGQKDLSVTLTWRNAAGLRVQKQFKFARGSYVVGVDYTIANHTAKSWQGNFYTQLKRKNVVPESSGIHRLRNTLSAAYSNGGSHTFDKTSFKSLTKEPLNLTAQNGWIAMLQHYFLSAWVPGKDKNYHYYSRANGDIYTVGMYGPVLKVAAGASQTVGSQLYVGPAIADNLTPLAKGLSQSVDYGWLWFISDFLFLIMSYIHSVVGNWGWSIVLVTVLVKAVFYHLSAKSYKSMAHIRELQPRIESLKKRLGDDKQKMGQAMMELYRKEKINPLGGCLPIIVQIPVFIALYYVLLESVQLRQSPFIFWIHDLSLKDPFYVLPLLMGASMFVQQKLSPAPPDPTQAKLMMALPIVFTFMFLSFPAGLTLYWLVNNVLSVAQQWSIMRRFGVNKKAKATTTSPAVNDAKSE